MQKEEVSELVPIAEVTDAFGVIRVVEMGGYRFLEFGDSIEQSCVFTSDPSWLEYDYTRAMLLGALDAHLHGLHTCDLAVTTLAIQVEQGAGIEHHFDAGVGVQTTLQNGIDIAWHHAHTMRVMTT